MLLSFQPLEDVSSVNSFRRVDSWRLNQSTTPISLYFQLVDVSKDAGADYKWPGFRYVPASGALLQVNLQNINDARRIVRVATQPFPYQDPSIWELKLYPLDFKCLGSPDILLLLTENSVPAITLPAAPAIGAISLLAVGNGVTITLSGGATFANPPATGTTFVIGVDSDLFIPVGRSPFNWPPQPPPPQPPNGGNQANAGFYLVTGTSSSTVITATKISDLFYGGLHFPQSVGIATPIPLTNQGSLYTGPAIQNTTGLVQSALLIQTMGQYAVKYQGPYPDYINDDLTGFPGWPNGYGGGGRDW
jgi:hypothetical protein